MLSGKLVIVSTLYRQYRPTTFNEVFGQEQVTATLQAAINKDKLTHAYLFHGPRGTGKTTTARILAKRVNCQQPNGAEPCGQCVSCLAVGKSSHTDVIEIDAASNRGIDDIRDLRERISTAPAMSRYKVYIIDEVHMLTNEASTALLKTLEEPVKHAIFILATTEIHKVLPTILSRCQIYRFRRASPPEMTNRLRFLLKKEKREAADDVLDLIIQRSDGCYRDAESLLGQLLTISHKKINLDEATRFLGLPPKSLIEKFLSALAKGESAPAVAAVDQSFADGHDLDQFLQESIRQARDLALNEIGQSNSSHRWADIIRALLQAIQDLAFVPQPIIALHLAILTVCTTRGNNVTVPPSKGDKEGLAKIVSNFKTTPTPATEPSQEQTKDVQKIVAVWPQLIDAVKTTNPVASTFLRAVEPISISGENITIRTKYSLHHNFFDNPKNKAIITASLAKLLNQPVSTSFILDDSNPIRTPTLAQQRQQQEEKFYQTVKEVFGS